MYMLSALNSCLARFGAISVYLFISHNHPTTQKNIRYATHSGVIAIMGIISVEWPTVATGHLCLYLYNSRPNRIRAVRIYIRILLGSRERCVRKQMIWHKWHVVEWSDPRHQIWAGAAMMEPPARCPVAQIPTYTTSWTVLSTQIWELCLMYIHVHHLYYLHARYYTFT